MPIYEYQCSDCQHQFDVLQKINDEHIKICPNCSKEAAVRLVSAAAFQLKGTGWYETDFKNKGASDTTSKDTTTTSSVSSEKKTTEAATVPTKASQD